MLQKSPETALTSGKDETLLNHNIESQWDQQGCVIDLRLNKGVQNLINISLENLYRLVLAKTTKKTQRIKSLTFETIRKNQNIYYISIKQVNAHYQILTFKTLQGDLVLYKYIETQKQADELTNILEQTGTEYPVYLLRSQQDNKTTSFAYQNLITIIPHYQSGSSKIAVAPQSSLQQSQVNYHQNILRQILVQEETCHTNIMTFFKLIGVNQDNSLRNTQNYYWLMKALGKSPFTISVQTFLAMFKKSLQCFKKLIQSQSLKVEKSSSIDMKGKEIQDESQLQYGSNPVNPNSQKDYYQMQNDNIQNNHHPFQYSLSYSPQQLSYVSSSNQSISSDFSPSQESTLAKQIDELQFFKSQCAEIERKMAILSSCQPQKYAWACGVLNMKLLNKICELGKLKEYRQSDVEQQVGQFQQ